MDAWGAESNAELYLLDSWRLAVATKAQTLDTKPKSLKSQKPYIYLFAESPAPCTGAKVLGKFCKGSGEVEVL